MTSSNETRSFVPDNTSIEFNVFSQNVTWNCTSVDSKNALKRLFDLIYSVSPNILILLETRVPSSIVHFIIAHLFKLIL